MDKIEKTKFILLLTISSSLEYLAYIIGFSPKQSTVIAIFVMSIVGTLFFWDLRLSFVFIGSGILLLIGAVDMEKFIAFAP